MSKCALDIRYDIIDTATEKLVANGAIVEGEVGHFPNPNKASSAINSINKEFKESVVQEGEKGSFTINPSESLVDTYFQEYLQSVRIAEAQQLVDEEIKRGGYTEEQRGEFFHDV